LTPRDGGPPSPLFPNDDNDGGGGLYPTASAVSRQISRDACALSRLANLWWQACGMPFVAARAVLCGVKIIVSGSDIGVCEALTVFWGGGGLMDLGTYFQSG
jgi:hypothetical protein